MKRSTFFISTTFIILVLLLYPALAAAEKNDFGLISVNSSSVKVEFLTPIISETKILTVDNNTVEVKAKSLKELQNCIILSNSKITVDVDSCPELEKQAKISFKGIEYKNPRVFRNGLWVKDIKPIQVSKNEYYITVDGFSTWELKDSTFNGTFNNMTLYSGALGLLADTVFSMNDDWNNTNVTSTDTTQDYTSYSSNGSLTYIEYHTDSRDPAHSAWYQDYLRMGSEYNWVEIPNGTILINPNNTWSFGGEFNFKSNNNQLMGKPNSASSGSNLVLSIGSNNKFSCNCLNSTGSSIGISGTTNASIDGVTYYNISCVYNGTNILQYVNGNIDGTSTEVTCNSSYNSSFGIGSSFGTSTTVHHGNIRNTFYYRRTLNSTEVTNPYSANSTDLIFKIPLNDTNEITATDYSGNGYNASLRLFSRPVWLYNSSDGFEGRFTYPNYPYSVTNFAYGAITIPIKSSDNPRANISENFTVSSWNNIPATSNNGGFTLFNALYSMRMSSSNRPIVVMTLANGSTLPTLSGVTCGTAGTWVNIVAIYYNNSRSGIYCNGVKIHNITYQGPLIQNGNNLLIGPVAGGTATQPMGTITEFKIWDRILSDAEITELQNTSLLSQKNIYFKKSNYLSQVYNASDYLINPQNNSLLNIILNSTDLGYSVMARMNDSSTDLLNTPWTLGSTTGNQTTFSALKGKFFQILLNNSDQQTNNSRLVYDITFNSNATINASCTPPSINNNWSIDFADMCKIDSDLNLGAGSLLVTRSGTLTINANIIVNKLTLSCSDTSCKLVILPNKSLSLAEGTSWCYQETANISTECGGLDTGSYFSVNYTDPELGYDGNFTSYPVPGTNPGIGTISLLYINYTKPAASLPSSLLLIYEDLDRGVQNRSIPLDCWNQDPLQFQISYTDPGGLGFSTYTYNCWNGSTWSNSISGGTAEGHKFYEEGMFWKRLRYELFNFSMLCYQESSNTSNQTGIDGDCDLDYTGNYYSNGSWSGEINLTDGDWNSFGKYPGSGSFGEYYVNYTKPPYAVNATWEVKDLNARVNLTIPTDCFDNSNLTLKYYLTSDVPTTYTHWACYNTTTWKDLRNVVTGSPNNAMYEEAIHWNITVEEILDYQ